MGVVAPRMKCDFRSNRGNVVPIAGKSAQELDRTMVLFPDRMFFPGGMGYGLGSNNDGRCSERQGLRSEPRNRDCCDGSGLKEP